MECKTICILEKEGKDTLMRLAVVGSFLIAILHSILFLWAGIRNFSISIFALL